MFLNLKVWVRETGHAGFVEKVESAILAISRLNNCFFHHTHTHDHDDLAIWPHIKKSNALHESNISIFKENAR
jgi:hypothetical protein